MRRESGPQGLPGRHEAAMSTVSLTGMTRRRVAVLASRGRRRLTPDRRKVHRHPGQTDEVSRDCRHAHMRCDHSVKARLECENTPKTR